jgi:acetyl-CoA synthetase
MPEDKTLYHPSNEIVRTAHIPDYEALRVEAAEDPQAFWEARARELLDWYEPWNRVLDDSDAPFFKWFTGAKTNVVLNALDRHQDTPTRNKLALVWEGEDGTLKTYSYFALNREVCEFANVLKSMGVRKGDRVTIYLPRIPELWARGSRTANPRSSLPPTEDT